MADATMAPEWRQCKSFPEYEVSDTGLVRKGGTLRKLQYHPYGYTMVCITAKPKQLKLCVHRLIAEAFHGPGPAGHEVDHINGDKTDNSATNLRWLTVRENRSRKRSRKDGLTARELQERGIASSPTLHVDARWKHGQRVGNSRNTRKTKSKGCGYFVEQSVVVAEGINGKEHLSPLHVVELADF